MNTFAISDIHGCVNELRALVDRVNPQKGDEFVFLGDYIDRGGYSFEVIEYLIELSQRFSCVFLRGNHEDMFFDYLSGLNESTFLQNGGNKTLRSYKGNGCNLNDENPMMRLLPKKHKLLFQEMKYLYETDDYIFVHAGIDTDYIGARHVYSKQQSKETVLWDRDFHYQKRHLYIGPKTVIYGHTPGDRIANEEFAVCIDTGICFGGKLTCLVLPERKTISVR